jgi:hypothetical protein
MADSINNSAAGANTDSKFIHQIDNQLFYIEIYMFNQLEKFSKPFPVDFYFVKGLCIEEVLTSWVTKGWIVLSNDFEIFERGSMSVNVPNLQQPAEQIEAPFCFRSDGRNKISIRIYPIQNSNNSANGAAVDPSDTSTDLPAEQWEMCYDFIIYDIEDLPTGSAAKKLRKFYFWDERYQIFLERNIEWSTSLYGSNKNKSNKEDVSRFMPIAGLSKNTGAAGAIESIITTAASNISDPASPVIKVGSTKGPSGIADPDIPLNSFDENNWDNGSSDSQIQYTSPAFSNVIDDLSYMFNGLNNGTTFLKASDGSPLFLRYERYLGDQTSKDWSLVPLTYYIKNSFDNQIERLSLELGEDPVGTKPRVDRAYPVDGSGSLIQNFQSGKASKITSYKIAPAVSLDTINLTNKVMHNYDFASGQFNLKYNGNKIEDLSESMGNIAKTGLYGYNNSNQLLLNIDRTKTLGLNIKNIFEARTIVPNIAGITNGPNISMQYDFLFLNQTLHFSGMGLTLRAPGKFLYVDREVSTGEYNPFDDKCIGQWLITSVKHVFTSSQYTTDVVANKIDSYHSWWDEIDTNDKYY